MIRQLVSFTAVALLTVTACGGGASPTPTPTAVPTVATPAPTPAPTPAQKTVTTSAVDTAGSGELFLEIPAGWITITARDIADEATFTAWQAARPEVSQDEAKAVAKSMSAAAVSLFAFDGQDTVGGFTPNLNIAWIDAPVSDFEPWLVKRAATVTKQYDLASPLVYLAWTPEGEGAVGGFIGTFRLSMNNVALAGRQLIVPMPDGRAAALTFTCRTEQTDQFAPIVEALFTSLSARS
jgi:hypothetical protein